MRIHDYDYGDLLDDGSTSSTRYKFDSGGCITSFWNNGNRRRIHCIYEGINRSIIIFLMTVAN